MLSILLLLFCVRQVALAENVLCPMAPMSDVDLQSPRHINQAPVPATKIPVSWHDDSCEIMENTYTIVLVETYSSYDDYADSTVTETSDLASTTVGCSIGATDISVTVSNHKTPGKSISADLSFFIVEYDKYYDECYGYSKKPVPLIIYEPSPAPTSTSSTPDTFSASPTQSAEMQTPKPTTTESGKQAKETSGSGGLSTSAQVGIGVGVPGAVALFLAIGFTCLRCHQKNKASIPNDDSERPENDSSRA